MEEQHRITQTGPLLTEQGTLREPGWATRPLLVYDRSAIRAPRSRIKEWDYYLITNRHHALALTIDDNSYMGLYSVSLLDFDNRREHTASPMVLFPMGRTNLPAQSAQGDAVSLPHRDYRFRFQKQPGRRILDCRIAHFLNSRPLEAHIELADADDESMVIATPFSGRPKAFYYNQKINCMPAEGWVLYDGRRYEFSPSDSFAVLDWGRGVWTYDNTWYWSSLNGLVDGRRFGFNLGCGFGDTSAASENMLFCDGRAHKLGRVRFDIPRSGGRDDFMSPWHFADDDGRLELEMRPLLDRKSRTDTLLLCSDQHQVFGLFSGRAVLDDGTEVRLADQLGFAEKVRNKW